MTTQTQSNGTAHAHERLDNASILESVLAATNPGADRPATLESEQLQIQVVTARRFQRSIKQFMIDAESMATISQEMAESCFYSVPRAGKTITGPSIRLAEICMSAWGHLDSGTRIKEIGKTTVTVEGFCWDMQNNNKVRQEIQRNITNKQGARYNADMITTTINAGASIALRNAILRIIPRAYIDTIAAKPIVSTTPAKFASNGSLMLRGYFDTTPSRLSYELDFAVSEGELKLIAIDVKVRDTSTSDAGGTGLLTHAATDFSAAGK